MVSLTPADYKTLGESMRKHGRLEEALSLFIESMRRGDMTAGDQLYSLGHASLQAYQYSSSLKRTYRERLLFGTECPTPRHADVGGPLPGAGRKAEIIRDYAAHFGTRFFVETGTFTGLMLLNVQGSFEEMFSFEISETLHRQAKQNLEERGVANAVLFRGDSKDLLPSFLATRISEASVSVLRNPLFSDTPLFCYAASLQHEQARRR